MSHPDGTIWRATYKTDGRITTGCIEVLFGHYLCSLDGEIFGKAPDLLTVKLAAYSRKGVPMNAWVQDDSGAVAEPHNIAPPPPDDIPIRRITINDPRQRGDS